MKKLLHIFTFWFLIAAALLGLGGCLSPKKLAERCAEAYPVQEKTTVVEKRIRDTIILPDHYVEYIDTTKCPASPEPTIITKTVTKYVPSDTLFRERIEHDTVFIRQDKALIAQKNNTITALQRQFSKSDINYQKARTRGRIWFWLLVVSVALNVYLLRRKQ